MALKRSLQPRWHFFQNRFFVKDRLVAVFVLDRLFLPASIAHRLQSKSCFILRNKFALWHRSHHILHLVFNLNERKRQLNIMLFLFRAGEPQLLIQVFHILLRHKLIRHLYPIHQLLPFQTHLKLLIHSH